MADYLLDTNHASRLMAREAPLAARVRAAQASGDRFSLSVTVLGELYYAVYASQRREENLRRLLALTEVLPVWPFDERAAEEFGRIQAEQKAAGRPIPPRDAQIAAAARTRGLVVLSADHHLHFVAGLVVQYWVVA